MSRNPDHVLDMLQTVSIESDSGSDYIFNKPWARAYAYLLGLACSFGFHTQGLAILQSKRSRRRQSGGHRADVETGMGARQSLVRGEDADGKEHLTRRRG